jgi:predicted permease
MLDILVITGPLFVLIGLGYAVVRSGLVSKDRMRPAGYFVLNVAMPAMLFLSLSRKPFAEIANLDYMAAYTLGSLAVFFAALAIARLALCETLPAAAIFGMGAACANSGFVGLPLLLQLLGPAGAVPAALTMIVENAVMFPVILAIAEAGRPGGAHAFAAAAEAVKRVARHPLILAIAAGCLVSFAGVGMPAFFDQAAGMIAKASAVVALFVVGSALAGLSLGGLLLDVALVAFGKLVLHPLAMVAALWFFPGLAPEMKVAAVVLACAPMLAIYPLMGLRYGQEGVAAARLLGTVIASFATISAALYVIKAGGWL